MNAHTISPRSLGSIAAIRTGGSSVLRYKCGRYSEPIPQCDPVKDRRSDSTVRNQQIRQLYHLGRGHSIFNH